MGKATTSQKRKARIKELLSELCVGGGGCQICGKGRLESGQRQQKTNYFEIGVTDKSSRSRK